MRMKTYQWVRIYLCLLASIRVLVLGLGMARGFAFYFPHIEVSIHLGFFALLFIFHWLVVMFYQSLNRWVLATALIANSLYTLLGRVLRNGNEALLIQEMIWFGFWMTILLDIVLFIYLLKTGIFPRQQLKNDNS